jgi:hypothetical protein
VISIASTPNSLKYLLKTICLVTLLRLALEAFFLFPAKELLLLNSLFYEKYFFWQPLTALVTLPINSLAFGELLDASFMVMLFWLTSLEVYLSFGVKRFFILLVAVTVTSASAALVAMLFFSYTGSFSLLPQAVLAFATIWTICPMRATPVSMLFFPMPSRWILGIALLATIGYTLFSYDYVRCIAYTASFVATYVIAIGSWYLPSPFPFLLRFDAFLKRANTTLQRFWNWRIARLFRS